MFVRKQNFAVRAFRPQRPFESVQSRGRFQQDQPVFIFGIRFQSRQADAVDPRFFAQDAVSGQVPFPLPFGSSAQTVVHPRRDRLARDKRWVYDSAFGALDFVLKANNPPEESMAKQQDDRLAKLLEKIKNFFMK